MKDDFGNRMKAYEAVTDMRLPGLTPVIVRVDGKCFHTLTKKLKKPFDPIFNEVMELTMLGLCERLPNVRFAYVQSDEISLVMLERNVHSESWFGNRLQKIASLTASYATKLFTYKLSSSLVRNGIMNEDNMEEWDDSEYVGLLDDAVFDCRAFPVPERDVCNYFIWRQQDCLRNAIQGAGQAYIGKKELHGMNSNEIIASLKEKGYAFSDFSARERLGAACYQVMTMVGTPQKGGIGFTNRKKYRIDANIPLFRENREFIEKHMELED